jgi:hypothetical protein
MYIYTYRACAYVYLYHLHMYAHMHVYLHIQTHRHTHTHTDMRKMSFMCVILTNISLDPLSSRDVCMCVSLLYMTQDEDKAFLKLARFVMLEMLAQLADVSHIHLNGILA